MTFIIDRNDPRDLLFQKELKTISAEYNVDSPMISSVINRGIARIIASDEPPESAAARLTAASRTVLEIRNEMLDRK